MIPLRDSIPNVHRPYGVWLLLAANVLAFALELSLNEQGRAVLFHLLGVVPARYQAFFGGQAALDVGDLLPFVTYMFLHSGWLHIIMNMWVLWVFADNVEDVMGTFGFLAFYVICGLGAVALHMVLAPASRVPVVGASGAIGGVMGAYFVLYPYGRVVTLIPIFIIPWIVELPAVIFLGIWFLGQLFSGVASFQASSQGGVAWWAHAGGFVTGLLLLGIFRKKERCYYCFQKSSRNYVRKW
jgi:membrane associated rhomboid family serine protease